MYITGYHLVLFRPVMNMLGFIMRLMNAGEAIIGVKTGILPITVVSISFKIGHFEIKMPIMNTIMLIMNAKMAIKNAMMTIMISKFQILVS